jgi:hypothetical protein
MSKEVAAEIRKVSKLCYSRVSVERYQSPSGPVQCYRCQKFGHTSKFCASRAQCMKCAKEHSTFECKKARDTAGRCCNCNGDHVASYRGCPVYQSARDRLATNKRVSSKPVPKQRFVDAPAPRVNAWLQRRVQTRQAEREEDFPAMPTRRTEAPTQQARPQVVNPPNIDISGMKQWAQTLLDALNKAKPDDRLSVILSHAMPLTMINAIFGTQSGSTSK